MNPSVFISYSWGNQKHQNWVKKFAARLRSDGVEAVLDQWELVPGDQLTHFMERAIADNQYVLIICTPTYKRKSEAREGGVGYEDSIMTAEVMTTNNHRKFIPILRTGSPKESVPSWLSGKIYIDLSGSPYLESSYDELLDTILGKRAKAPEVKKSKARKKLPKKKAVHNENNSISEFEDIKIVEIIADEVTVPRNDGTRGSALYKVPFLLSSVPPSEWKEIFIINWDSPLNFTTKHRPGTARLYDNKLILERTTIEEVNDVHKKTLKLVIEKTNADYRNWKQRVEREEAEEQARQEEHRQHVNRLAESISFD